MRQLHELFESDWDYQMEQNPTWASALGDRRWNDRWPDVSLESYERRHQYERDSLAALLAIDRTDLSASDQLNYDLFERGKLEAIEGHRFNWHLIPMNQRGGIQTEYELCDTLRFETEPDYTDWISRLRAFGSYADQTIALLREGIRSGMMLPRVVMDRIPPQIEKLTESDANPFFKPFQHIPDPIPGSRREELRSGARTSIQDEVIPGLTRIRELLIREYLPKCPEQVGIWQLPAGEEMYAYFVRHFTTTSLSPGEVHEIGLSEVKRIRAAMEAIRRKIGFGGTLAQFFAHLRTDRRFYLEKPNDLLAAYRAVSKRIDPLLVKLFKTLPRTPYGVDPIPAQIAPDTTTAYYMPPAADGSRAGTYYVNLYKPEVRPTYEMMALSLHEAVPGHHLQIALAMEQGELPKFRRYGGFTAYVEGWALYAEALGDEMGLYDDPYSKFGQLTYEMWRAVRLVVDTGIHAMRWDRRKAIDFFLDNAAKAAHDVINEVDRYIAWPGQALAYKIGELKMKELRKKAESALGSRFDIRGFHDVILGIGAVPLDTLEDHVGAWLDCGENGMQA